MMKLGNCVSRSNLKIWKFLSYALCLKRRVNIQTYIYFKVLFFHYKSNTLIVENLYNLKILKKKLNHS